MTTTMMIIVIACAVVVVALAVRFVLRRRTGTAVMPLRVKGLGIIGYDGSVMSRGEAEVIAFGLGSIRRKVLAQLEYIYGRRRECAIAKLKLDIHYHKPAEWPAWPERLLVVNPTLPKHRVHFAEETHNLYRIEMYGYEHRYKPVDEADRVNREQAQEFCRGV